MHSQEATQRRVNLSDDKPFAIEGLLTYIYTLEYPSSVLHTLLRAIMGDGYLDAKAPRPTAAQVLLWTFDLEIFKVADKFGLVDLAKEAEDRLLDNEVEISGEHIGFVAFIRGVYNLGETKKMHALRQKVVRVYDKELCKALDEPLVVELVQHIPDLGIDAMKSLVKRVR